jgi:hypothetical protein
MATVVHQESKGSRFQYSPIYEPYFRVAGTLFDLVKPSSPTSLFTYKDLISLDAAHIATY